MSPITLNADPCWEATCDGCGEGDNPEYGGSYHHPSREVAEENLRESDWRQTESGEWLCEGCASERRPQVHGV